MKKQKLKTKKGWKIFDVETPEEYFARGGKVTYLPIGMMSKGITMDVSVARHHTKNGKQHSTKNCWNWNR